jgi:membrane protease YdiL (CAAX protease family)
MIKPNKLWKIVLFFIFFPLKSLVLLILLSLFGINSLSPIYGQFLSLILALILLVLMFQLYKKDVFNSLFKKGFKIKYLLILILISLLIRLPILPLIFGLLNNNSEAIVKSQWPTMIATQGTFASYIEYIFLIINIVILAPFLEELFHRGVVFNYLKNKFSPILTIIISGFLFALIHGNILLIASTLISGLMFAYVYYKTEDIKYPILLHSLVNLFPFVIPYIFLLLK